MTLLLGGFVVVEGKTRKKRVRSNHVTIVGDIKACGRRRISSEILTVGMYIRTIQSPPSGEEEAIIVLPQYAFQLSTPAKVPPLAVLQNGQLQHQFPRSFHARRCDFRGQWWIKHRSAMFVPPLSKVCWSIGLQTSTISCWRTVYALFMAALLTVVALQKM
jgi:hypothetical protein